MTPRHVLIVTAFALPVVLIGMIGAYYAKYRDAERGGALYGNIPPNIIQETPPPINENIVPLGYPDTLEEARTRNKELASELEQITQDEWANRRAKTPWLSADKDKALAKVKQRLDELNAMSDDTFAQEKARYLRKANTPQQTPRPATPESVEKASPLP